MTREEAKAIIRKEYLCVDRDCDIERSCGKCDLMMPSKEPILEAYKMAIQALEQEPSDDCISRQAVHDMIEGFIADATSHGISARLDPYYVMNGIKYLPSVNLQEKTGHWIFDEILDRNYYCSECKSMGVDYWDYCPYCGARMVEPQETKQPEISSFYGLKSYVRERSDKE